VLHFPPTERTFGEGELVLVDAGAEYRCYASDVTRTYPVSGRFDAQQAELHALVHSVQRAAVQRCLKDTEYREIHRQAAREIAKGLVDFGLLRGDVDSLLEQGVHSLFLPHGIGHMVGLGVRDAGEVLPGRRPDLEGMPRLRLDLPLRPGHVVTIEPGIYFIPALLQDPELRHRHRDGVNWDLADRMLDFGGIRVEDNVLVTEDGYEVLTAEIPVLG
jgi:Xaa-Pro aminopeptidase